MTKVKKQKYKDNEFYSVADKKKIIIKAEDIKTEKKNMKNGKTSYMLRAKKDGRNLVKFVNEDTFKKYS
jgi:hypothetical protein